jgi:hypothetical protein
LAVIAIALWAYDERVRKPKLAKQRKKVLRRARRRAQAQATADNVTAERSGKTCRPRLSWGTQYAIAFIVGLVLTLVLVSRAG